MVCGTAAGGSFDDGCRWGGDTLLNGRGLVAWTGTLEVNDIGGVFALMIMADHPNELIDFRPTLLIANAESPLRNIFGLGVEELDKFLGFCVSPGAGLTAGFVAL